MTWKSQCEDTWVEKHSENFVRKALKCTDSTDRLFS